MYIYKLYGLTIKSQLKLVELLENEDKGKYDVEFVYDEVNEEVRNAIKNNKWFFRSKDVVWYDIKDVAIFYIYKGKKVIIEPKQNANFEDIKSYLLGGCMGFLLYQRGSIGIHGGVLENAGKALIILGEGGVGKSTLTTAFRLKGKKFLSDDVASININDEITVNPGYPGQRLCEDIVEKFNIDKSKLIRLETESKTKYMVNVKRDFIDKPVVIGTIVELIVSDKDNVTAKKIMGSEKLKVLMKHLFMFGWVREFGVDREYMKKCILLAQRVNMYRVGRPKEGLTVAEQMECIEKLME